MICCSLEFLNFQIRQIFCQNAMVVIVSHMLRFYASVKENDITVHIALAELTALFWQLNYVALLLGKIVLAM